MLLLTWTVSRWVFVLLPLTWHFWQEHLSNWNYKETQRGSIFNASHKQHLTYTILASNFLKLWGQGIWKVQVIVCMKWHYKVLDSFWQKRLTYSVLNNKLWYLFLCEMHLLFSYQRVTREIEEKEKRVADGHHKRDGAGKKSQYTQDLKRERKREMLR